ncbi:ASCH domain-containing protein [Mycolicibacterium conceptionense]|uniref:hypothetical protein n=1 Tax=Mycolicibacterium conceptionense TaxID=451644 RepID=UPI00096E1210|nr:hypothetical protein [Mycolicibacterium conceptionense]OMB79250.1 hypothetical protein A5743_14185 [Mycolicibacterium conceptionense]
MRAITVRQPWAWQIINQGKNIENRTRNIAGKYRGPVAIHAGLQPDKEALRRLPKRAPEWVTAPRVFDYGVILGVVDLVDVHEAHTHLTRRDGPMLVGPAEHCCTSGWAEPGSWHLVLANPRPVSANPVADPGIPCRGALGLWTPPPDIVARLDALTAPVVEPCPEWQLVHDSPVSPASEPKQCAGCGDLHNEPSDRYCSNCYWGKPDD